MVVFDPAGDIAVADNRLVADSRAARFAAVADEFAARFGLEGADDWADELAAQLEADDASSRADVAADRRAAETAPSAVRWIDAAGSVGAAARPRRVTITGRGAEGYAIPRQRSSRRELAARRPMPTLSERMGFRADRAALWAVALGLLLVLVAAMSAHAG